MKTNNREYVIVGVDGKMERVTLGQKATLEQLQKWVGGYIQIVQILPKQWIVVNEEGAVNGMKMNTAITHNGEPLFGSIVFLPRGCHS